MLRWLPQYFRWFFYAFATTYLRRGPNTVTLKVNAVRQTNVNP
jgi:dolichol-phosphate mannosyltransferase